MFEEREVERHGMRARQSLYPLFGFGQIASADTVVSDRIFPIVEDAISG